MANSKSKPEASHDGVQEPGRRDFIVVSTYAMAGLGAAAVAWPLIDQMNPAADTLALASTEVDVSKIAEGQAITVTWRGKPVFIRHRTADEIARANAITLAVAGSSGAKALRLTGTYNSTGHHPNCSAC